MKSLYFKEKQIVSSYLVRRGLIDIHDVSTKKYEEVFNNLLNKTNSKNGKELLDTIEKGRINLQVLVHLQDKGDLLFRELQFAGTRGERARLEGFSIAIKPNTIDGLGLKYMAHIEHIGDRSWEIDPTFVGTRGKGLRLEGFAIDVTGANASQYVIYYRAHVQDFGDSKWYKNGEFCGTRGEYRRIEGIEVSLERK
ncbi:hypothetical protein [Chondrinema litorale]|uniref:hypothetical protein n=1 Tax=Chondrinema litorale TaxID=2994555 RepID=UPI00254376E4|nr:hypothetical protein [Chondrinema litorale]UZS00081.1 hypothetical protein OQ292_39770 [Chondrinema litorale]